MYSSTRRITSRGLDGYLKYKRDLSQERAAEATSRLSDNYGERDLHATYAMIKDTQKIQPMLSSGRTSTEPSPIRTKNPSHKSPLVKKEQSPLIKKNTAASSSAQKTKGSGEKTVLKPQQQQQPRHYHTKSQDSQAFYSSVKGVLKEIDTPDYSTEMVSQVQDRSQESAEQS